MRHSLLLMAAVLLAVALMMLPLGGCGEEKKADTGAAPSGATLFQQKGCTACHQVNGMGTGSDLSHVASQPYITGEYLEKWLSDPKSVKPDTAMPRTSLTDEERHTLVQYLLGLK